MKLRSKTYLALLALVALTLVCMPTTLTASNPLTLTLQEAPAASVCSVDLAFDGSLDFLSPQAATGCDPANCDASCRAQGYDKGVCFGSECICRFYYP